LPDAQQHPALHDQRAGLHRKHAESGRQGEKTEAIATDDARVDTPSASSSSSSPGSRPRASASVAPQVRMGDRSWAEKPRPGAFYSGRGMTVSTRSM
jgi:hypothetical protein